MPNIICEELVMKNGKVDIVEQECSKMWNEKIQRLEEENKELKEKYEQGLKHVLDLTEENTQLKEKIYGDGWLVEGLIKGKSNSMKQQKIMINQMVELRKELAEKEVKASDGMPSQLARMIINQ
jgi:hypothetical protein